jgi:serine/threonine protein kinase
MSKGYVVGENLKEAVLNEKTAMSMLESPFVLRLYRTFMDEQYLYFLLQPALGGELFERFHQYGEEWFGSEEHSKFYTSCASLALDHIHSWKIVYRDLKLENVLLDERGYALLSDFGLAKVVVGKTYTVCGTADYFAPETLRQHGHNRAVDWWALGVMLFIMMSGRSPFDAEDVMQIYKNIVKGFKKETFPENFPVVLIDIIKGLCRKKPEERLPMGPGGLKNLKEHPWYAKYGWDSVAKKSVDAPFIPPAKTVEEYRESLTVGFEEPPMVAYEDDGTNWDAEFCS